MGFNNMVNLGIAFAGILEFLGLFGGLAFLIFAIDLQLRFHKTSKTENKSKCETCETYKSCLALFGGRVPENGCAYYKSDEEVEISVN